METATPETEQITDSPNGDTPHPEPAPETSPAEKQDVDTMYQFSEYVHVGPEAADCEDGENGACSNPLHFHAWCRLPNQFQNASIREKALAAKARKARLLRDPASDAYEILEAEMDQLRRGVQDDPDSTGLLVEDLLNQSYWKHHLTAVRELAEEEEWATIAEDQVRLRHLSGLPAEDRPTDEYDELQRHNAKYDEALKAKREELMKPERDALEAKDLDDLIKDIRESRIDAEANEEFMRTFSMWEWYIGTMKPRDPEKGLPTERVFGDVNHLQAAAPEVVEMLEYTFGRLETALGTKQALGNS